MFRLALLFNTINPPKYISLLQKTCFLPFGWEFQRGEGSNGKNQRKFLLVALNPLLAFSLMFSKRPGFVCSPSFLNSWSSTLINCKLHELRWSIVVFTITFVHCHTFTLLPTLITITYLPSMMAMWPVWPKVNSSAGWLMLAKVESP